MAIQKLTADFFIYQLSNAEGTCSKLVLTERELTKEEFLPIRKVIMETAGWVVEAFGVSRYLDEDRLNYLAKRWSEPRPSLGLRTQDIKADILRPFDANDHIFGNTKWREVFSFDSI